MRIQVQKKNYVLSIFEHIFHETFKYKQIKTFQFI